MRNRMAAQAEQPPQVLEVHGSQLRYTMAQIRTAGYEVLEVQRAGEHYIVVVATPEDAQLPTRTTTTRSRRGRRSIGSTLRGFGSGLIVVAIGVAVLGPAVTMLGTGVGTGLTVAAGGVLASSVLLLPAALITLLILALLPAAAQTIAKARREYGNTRRGEQ